MISREEEEELNALIAEDPDALEHWEAIRKYHESPAVAQIYRDVESSAPLDTIWESLERRFKERFRQERRRRIMYVTAMAAAVVGALLFISLPFKKNLVTTDKRLQIAGIELQLPDGKKIDLSKTEGQVPIGATTLRNANNILSYNTTSGSAPAGLAVLKVPVGKDYKLQLADGSEVWLNSSTTVTFPFSFGNSREITISGEAYIKVAPDPNKPFLVKLPGSTVQVLGTEFNINTYDNGLDKVALVKGSVKLQTPGQSLVIQPGYQAVYTKGKGIQAAPFEDDLTLSWRRGIYAFYDISLEEICQVLPRWFGVQVVMDNQRVAGKRFAGELDRNKPLSKQLKLFSDGGVTYYYEGEVLHFK
ncbi:ferric-dicitrate binding protein FerR (iron transport regulator) [Chitinophaga terrae (ex Kim and Jung 2007)]|uniref:FecR family protein n=1 Tax=Chitinophaga terrae (ex Kim and Jung 2007) TaxID=408074 RepID=UPI00277E67A6|nr:FecR domain-containing protein [Chitinophaga terrae (ex Kim and Jung 2007)]MDQ0107502.1 ferric-dicitrate binding protein FerR (iron transport regulator) [Chitinophaga terrae (ex Kim and Jung 2007)]